MADTQFIANLEVTDAFGPRFKITPEGGYAVRLLNGTGVASVKGELVSASTTTDLTFIKQANEYCGQSRHSQRGNPDCLSDGRKRY